MVGEEAGGYPSTSDQRETRDQVVEEKSSKVG